MWYSNALFGYCWFIFLKGMLLSNLQETNLNSCKDPRKLICFRTEFYNFCVGAKKPAKNQPTKPFI